MDTDVTSERVQHTRLPSFSVREQQHYRAEKMLMRQFMLMKEQHEVPIYLSTKDMKAWLLAGRHFLEEFQETAQQVEERRLLMVELAWSSARRSCLDQMEQELREELEKEKRLSLQFSRKVTVEGLQMFLSVIRPKAEQDVWTFLSHLSNKLLSSFTDAHTSKQAKLALLTKLHFATRPLVTQMVDIALQFLLDEPEPVVEVKRSQTGGSVESRDSSLTSALRNRSEAASAEIGRLLADTAASCFCLNTSFIKARLVHICTSAAQDMVKAIYKRFVDRSETFHLMSFDESSITARDGAVCAIQDMDDRAQSAGYELALQLFTEDDPTTPELCPVEAAERTDEKEDEGKRGLQGFLSRIWRKIMRVSTEE